MDLVLSWLDGVGLKKLVRELFWTCIPSAVLRAITLSQLLKD